MGRFAAGWACVAIVTVAIVGSAESALAQKASDSLAKDKAALGQASKACLAALELGDTKALANFWTSEGTYVNETGERFNVRNLIEKNAGAGRQNHTSRPQAKVSDVTFRFISADVAIEEGVSEIPSSTREKPIKVRFMALWVRQDDRWKLDNLREWRSSSLARDERLASLDPLSGTWMGSAGNVTMRVSARWNLEKTFLHRALSIETDGQESFSGTQEIGLDPISQQIKSWAFNGDGSYGEGTWSLEGNAWMVVASRTLPNGQTESTTKIFKFAGKDTLIYTSMSANADGELIPNFEIKLSRQPSQK